MSSSSRRSFLKTSVAGAASVAALQGGSLTAAEGKTADSSAGDIPPHRPLNLPGLHAYAEKSVAAGETIHFGASSTVPYVLSIARLAGDVDNRDDDEVIKVFDRAAAKPQPIHPGSYVHVEKALPNEPLKAITLQCWVRPWKLNAFQGLVTQFNRPDACGVGLFLDEKGRACFYLGDGGEEKKERMFVGPKLKHRRWAHVAGTFDGKTATLWVHGKVAGKWALNGEVKPGKAPLRLAALGEAGLARKFLEGDLAMPTLHSRSLSASEIKTLIFLRAKTALPYEVGLLARWRFSEENGATVADDSPHKRHGRIINHATWMIGGPSFVGEKVPRYDRSYDPTKDPNRGHGLRFAADDLYDCRWETTHEFTIPKTAQSGVYVGRYKYRLGTKAGEYFVTFIVRRPEDRPKAPVLMLCSSSTWIAYNSAQFPVAVGGPHNVGTHGIRSDAAKAPAYSCYRDHHSGQPTYYMGMKTPWPAAGPDVLYSPRQVGYSHLMRGELFTHRWLDGQYDGIQYDYDVVTDYDLHRDPKMLDGYKTIVINGHSEYWSGEAYDAVDEYLKAGGTVIGLSGNTMFWRTTFSEDGNVMECRKFDARIGGRGGASIGELYHSHDKKRGSMMRECGYPAWKNIGLECVGWAAPADAGVFHLDVPDHFLFQQPEKIGLAKGSTFGHVPGDLKKYPRAITHEWDIRMSTLHKKTKRARAAEPVPTDVLEDIVTLARGVRPGGGTRDYYMELMPNPDGVCAEMIYWQRPSGGRVFHTGAIGAGWTLSGDPRLRMLLRNVLHHFGVKRKDAKDSAKTS